MRARPSRPRRRTAAMTAAVAEACFTSSAIRRPSGRASSACAREGTRSAPPLRRGRPGRGEGGAGGAAERPVVHEDGDAIERALDVDFDAAGAELGGATDAIDAVFGGVLRAGAVSDDEDGHAGRYCSAGAVREP